MEVSAPKYLSEITLAEYQRWNESEDEFHTVDCFCTGDVRALTLPNLKIIYNEVIQVLNSDSARQTVFMWYKDGKWSSKDNGGELYGLQPNLQNKLSTGSFIDATQVYGPNGVKSMHNLLAILYRPVTHRQGNRYRVEAYNEDHQHEADIFKAMPMDLVNGILSFFLPSKNRLLETLVQSSTEIVKEIARETLGGGTEQ